MKEKKELKTVEGVVVALTLRWKKKNNSEKKLKKVGV